MKYRFLSFLFLVLLLAVVFLFPVVTHTYTLVTYKIYRRTPIVFIPGLHLTPGDYKTLLTDLANEHYQVLTYTPKDTNASDYQEIVKEWSQGVSKEVGDRKVIVIGHSIGGSTAAYFCSIDTRCVAGINLDGAAAFDKKIPVPFLYIQADAGNYCDQQCVQGRVLMEKVTKESGTSFVHINGIKHYNFTDIRTVAIRNQDYLGSIDGRDIITEDINAFLAEKTK